MTHDPTDPGRRAGPGPTLSWFSGVLLVVAAMALLALVGACGRGDKTLLEADPEAVPLAPSYDAVRAILDRNCVPCHKGQGSDLSVRPNFETCEGVLGDLGRIVQDAVQLEKMPPGAWPRLTEEEKLTLLRWIQNGACAPCKPCP